KFGLAVVLVFIGSKMLIADLVHVSTPISLGVVATAIGTSILLSLKRAADPDASEAGAADAVPAAERERRVASL
ncbi:MAG TPA: hypothetical protein VGD27_07235, partial [Longimicrobiales bacterium]